MNNEEKRPPRRHQGPPGMVIEKPKNLGLTLKRLVKELKTYLVIIIFSFILAITSSIFAIIGPNKLPDLTDELSKGLVVNTKELEKISNDISSTLNEDGFKEISIKITSLDISNETIYKINTSKEISIEDKKSFNEYLKNINDNKDITSLINLPDSVLAIILPDINIDNILVSTLDRKEFIKVISEANYNDPSKMVNLITLIPESIQKVLLPDSKVSSVLITTRDKVTFISKMGSIDKNMDAKTIYKKMDELPNSINSLIKPKIDLDAVKSIAIFLLVLYILSAIFNFLQGFFMAIISNGYARKLRTSISIKINKLALKYFDNHQTGDILSRVTNDVDTLGFNLSQTLGTFVGAVALFIGSIIMMFKTNYLMAITAILSSLFGFIFMSVILSKSQKYFNRRQVELGKLNGHIEEIYSSHNVVKAYNGRYDASRKFDELNDNVFECNRMSQFLSGLVPSMMGFIGNFGYVCVCIVGAVLVIDNKISFGVIVAFMIYVRLFTSPLSQIGQAMTSVQSTAAAAERVFEFVDEEEMEDESNLKGKLDVKKVKGSIEFKHVKFGYDKDKLIIKDFNCKVKPGSKIAIVGPTGAGKTTIVNLLMKFYNINDGDILIDGVSIKDLPRQRVHDLFIMVLQDTWLFDGTIRENIKYNKKNVSDKKIMEALEVVGVDHFVKSLPGNLDYVLKDVDAVSQGEKQLLTIARGMIKDAPFLILDEATSSVDTRTEELVQKAMDKLTKGRTSFIIAHRLSTIRNADLILVMNEGNIIEQGNHEELMNQNGFYAELYNSQFKN